MFAKRKISFLAVAALLSACSDYVDKIEEDYKEQYGDTEKYFENLNKVDADLASICESGTWFWCATRNGTYVTSNNGLIEPYSLGDTRFTFLAVDDNSYDYSTNTLDDNLLPYLRRNGGISVVVSGDGDFKAGLKINTGDYFSALAENNVVIAYENNCSGVKVNLDVVATTDYMWKNKVVAEGTVVYRLSKELQTSGLLVQTLDPDQLTIEVGDNDWRTIASSISSSENKDKLTSVITVEFTKSCADDTHGITFIGAGLVPTQRAASSSSSSNKGGTTTSGSSTEKIELAGNLITCAPKVSKVKVGESVKWEFTLSSEAISLITLSAINVAHSVWTLDGGEPSTSVKDGPSNISSEITYSTSGTKKASLDYTARNYHGTFTCSTLEVVENETASSSSTAKSSSSTAKSSSSVTPDNPTTAGFLWDGSKKSDFVKTDFGSGNKWYIFTDADTDSGSTYVSVLEINPYDVCLGKCIGVKFGEPVGNNERQPYAGVGFDLGEGGATYDVSEWQGICIAYQSIITIHSSAELRVDLRPYDPDYYGYNIPAHTLPVNVTGLGADYHIENILWSEFAQRWNDTDELSGTDVAAMLRGISITLESDPNTVAYLNIYQIGSYGQCGQVRATSVDMSQFPFPESSSSAESSSSSAESSNSAEDCSVPNIWCKNTSYRVNTGVGAAEDNGGYWWATSDASGGGLSTYGWPAEKTEYDGFDYIIDECMGLCGTYTLNKGDLNPNPWIMVGFSIAGKSDPAYDNVPADVSDWGGICVTYTSDSPMRIELHFETGMENAVKNDVPFVAIPAQSSAEETCVSWSEFSQSGWGAANQGGIPVATDEALKYVKDIAFMIQDDDGVTGSYNIIRLRKMNAEGVAVLSPWSFLNYGKNYGLMQDSRDGKLYKTIDVGNYTWFAQNLNLEYNDGEGNSCPGSDPDSCAKYGRMYTWAAAMDTAGVYSTQALECGAGKVCGPIDPVQGVCPEGWHLPSNAEWRLLVEAAGGESTAAVALKSTKGWVWNSSNTSGTDDLGFSAIPNGPGEYGYFWSGTENSNISGYRLRLMGDATPSTHLGDGTKSTAMYAVRCVKEKNPKPRSGSFTYHGQTYNYVRIGTQTWMAENLNYDIGNNMCYENDPANCTAYGRMYKWATVVGKTETECGYGNSCDLPSTGHVQGICPEGWHVPRRAEVETLVEAAGGDDFAGKALKATSTWSDYENNGKVYGNGTDATGFTGYSTGTCSGSSSEPYCNYDGMYTHMWTITENYSGEQAYYFGLLWMGNGVTLLNGDKRDYKNLRCVQDED